MLTTCRVSSRGSYDNMGKPYDLNRITNADGTINMAAFKEYSPLYLSCVSALLLVLRTTLMRRMYVAWHSLCLTRFRSLPLRQLSPTPYFTSGNLLGYILAGRWRNNPIFTPDWCQITDKVWSSLRVSLQELRPLDIVPEWWYACIFGISLSFSDSILSLLTYVL